MIIFRHTDKSINKYTIKSQLLFRREQLAFLHREQHVTVSPHQAELTHILHFSIIITIDHYSGCDHPLKQQCQINVY